MPAGALALGLDHSDFIAAMAPKPVVLLGKERDFFDARALEEAYQHLQHLYCLLGKQEDIQLLVAPGYHSYSKESREAMYRMFNHVTHISQAAVEPELALEKDEDLWCTPHGQVDAGSQTVFSFTQARSKQLAAGRQPLEGAALAQAVETMLHLPPRTGKVEYRILRALPRRKRAYPRERAAPYMVQTEPGIYAFVYRIADEDLISRPPQGFDRAVLYVAHQSSDAELRREPLVKQLLDEEPEAAFYTCDVRGIGESQPNTANENSFLDPYGCDYLYAIHAIMLGEPYVGRRTHDVLRVLDWLQQTGHKEVHVAGLGWGALPATFAALLSPLATQVTLKHALVSYRDVAETEDYEWPLSALLPGVLTKCDLPDCYRALEAKQLRQIEPWDARARNVREPEA